MRYRLGILCLLVLVLAAGCGRRMALEPNKPARAPMTGDTAKYVTKVLTGFDNSQFRRDTDDTVTIQVGTNHSSSVPAGLVQTFDAKRQTSNNSGSHTTYTWFGEDAQNNIYLLGISGDGQEWDLVTDSTLPLMTPGSPSVGANWGFVAHLASGVTMTYSGKVAGTEWLTTRAGKFEAYKIEESTLEELETPLGKSSSSTSGVRWVSPRVHGLDIQNEQKTDKGQMGGEETQKMHLNELTLVETKGS